MSAKKFVLVILAVALAFAGLVYAANRDSTESKAPTSRITATDSTYDFGTISMKAGNVAYATTIMNISDEPVTISKLHTSCMCTEVIMTIDSKNYGPYGMEGHGGTVPKIDVVLKPGQEARLDVEFDPAAHGSAGIGQIERSIFVDGVGGARTELKFKASVTP